MQKQSSCSVRPTVLCCFNERKVRGRALRLKIENSVIAYKKEAASARIVDFSCFPSTFYGGNKKNPDWSVETNRLSRRRTPTEYRACGRDVAPHSRVPQISVNGGTHSMYADGEGVGAGRGRVGGIKGNDVNRPWWVPLHPRECDWVAAVHARTSIQEKWFSRHVLLFLPLDMVFSLCRTSTSQPNINSNPQMNQWQQWIKSD